jgi:hypothetical protein
VEDGNLHENQEIGFKNIIWASIKIKKLRPPIELNVFTSAVFEMCFVS